MSLLAPLFLLGALAVALPILFHRTRQRVRETRQFGSIMFLAPTPPRVTRRSRLENLVLLLLRCLVIGLVALAFARPFIQRALPVTPDATQRYQRVLLVDTSASMKRAGLWPALIQRATETLNAVDLEDSIAILVFDRAVRPLVSFEQWQSVDPAERRSLALEKLRLLEPSWAGTDLGNALIRSAEALVDEVMRSSATKPKRLEIVVLSDLQEGSQLDTLLGFEWPAEVSVQFETLAPSQASNAGLQWLPLQPDAWLSQSNTTIRIRVLNAADAETEQFELSWEGAPDTAPEAVYVPPGQSRILQLALPGTNQAVRGLTLRGDRQDFDNTVHLVPPQPERLVVLYAGESDTQTAAPSPRYFLERAFLETPFHQVELRDAEPLGTTTDSTVTDARLMVVVPPLAPGQSEAIERFLDSDGTVLWVMSDVQAADPLNPLLKGGSLGATEAIVRDYALFSEIDFRHPLFAVFADPRYSDFTKIHFWKYRRLDLTALPEASVLVRFDNQDPALVQWDRNPGRLLVLASGWHPEDSQLAVSSKFVPWLYSLLEWSGGLRPRLQQTQVGDGIVLPTAADESQLVIRKPDGQNATLPVGETRFAETQQPGIYTVTSVTPPLEFAVNLDPNESETTPLSPDELGRLGVPLGTSPAAPTATSRERKQQQQRTEAENQQRLWRWLLAAALVLVVGETLLAAWLTRRQSLPAAPESATASD